MLDISAISEHNHQKSTVKPFKERKIFVKILITLSLICAVLSGASSIPGCVSLKAENVFLKVFWRQCVTIPFLTIVSLFEIKIWGNTEYSYRQFVQTKKHFGFFLVQGFLYNVYMAGYTLSGMYTIMSHCTMFCNLGGCFIILMKIVTRKQIHKLEYAGLVIAMLGCFCIQVDSEARKVDPK